MNEGHNGLITYIMATESAKKYNDDTKKANKDQIFIPEINSTSTLKGEEELKNIRLRTDGRYEWRRQIKSIKYSLINKNKKILEKQVRDLLKKTVSTPLKIENKKTFLDIAWQWHSLYKKNLTSGKDYEYYLKARFETNDIFKQNIDKITFVQLQQFISSIKRPRVADYCYLIISGVYKEAIKRDFVKKDISKLITRPKYNKNIGVWFNIAEQKLILDNIDKSNMKYEILLYVLTGCRRSEALRLKLDNIDFNNYSLFVDGTKTKSAKRYIPISQRLADMLKEHLSSMFKFNKSWYSKTFQDYLKSLGIKNKKLHDLRHTFNTNLYYLGVPDKERQYYMGHSSIVMTNDIYTHLDPNVKKDDILNLYKDLYPKF